MPVQTQGPLEEALIQLSLTSSDGVVSREVVGPWKVGPVVPDARFCSSPEPWQHHLWDFPSTLPHLLVTVKVTPMARTLPHQRQGGTVGLSAWFSLVMGCSLVLPAMVNCEKGSDPTETLFGWEQGCDLISDLISDLSLRVRLKPRLISPGALHAFCVSWQC